MTLPELLAHCPVRPGENVLDLGCGDGSFVRNLAYGRSATAYGFDPYGQFPAEVEYPAVLFPEFIETALGDPRVRELDVDVLVSCDALQYVSRPLDHLARYLDHCRPRAMFCSLWHSTDPAVNNAWGFATPATEDQLRRFCAERGIACAVNQRFSGRIDRQLRSLETYGDRLAELWGGEALDRRRRLEEAAVAAVASGALRQICLYGSPA
ncbi:class I SAM-dependent methyltransferase [Streptomyces sp. bgisy153]|uniref:class I SAM-dependent methyltransferase n=1 Tax=Streptomyces sp. bgisy153 TaxID=3413793 RepID=UPI003D718874